MEILIISGLSGAGKSSAATYLEDMGYYTVDNVPADIILKFAEFCAQSDGRYDRVALVSDIRSGNGNFQGILDAMERLKQGGYRMARRPEDYTARDILRLTEGSLAPVACLDCEVNTCPRSANCPTLPLWQGLDRVIEDYLTGVTLQDLIDRQREHSGDDYVI